MCTVSRYEKFIPSEVILTTFYNKLSLLPGLISLEQRIKKQSSSLNVRYIPETRHNCLNFNQNNTDNASTREVQNTCLQNILYFRVLKYITPF